MWCRNQPPSFLGVLLAAAMASGCSAGRPPNRQWLDAAARSPKGDRVYERECASCHGAHGEGSRGVPDVTTLPLNRGDRRPFRTAADLFDYVSKEMPLPLKRAGALSDGAYWAVVELLLRARGTDLPAEGLSADSSRKVQIN